jgi:hypothetical protein
MATPESGCRGRSSRNFIAGEKASPARAYGWLFFLWMYSG